MVKIIPPFSLGRGIEEKLNIAIVTLYAACMVFVFPMICFIYATGIRQVLSGRPFLVAYMLLGIPVCIALLYVAMVFLYSTAFAGFTHYRPTKSFWQVRMARKNAIVYYRVLAALGAFYLFDQIVFMYFGGRLFSTSTFPRVGNGLFLTLTAYYGLVSLRVHANLDHVSCLALRRAGVISERDRVYASYQNFDSSNAEVAPSGASVFAVLGDRIVAMHFSGREWKSVEIAFKEISDIGLMRYGGDIYLGVRNNGGQFIRITLDVMRLVSEPINFINAVLDQIDSYLTLGSSAKSRRRVVEYVDAVSADIAQSNMPIEKARLIDERVIEQQHPFIGEISTAVPMSGARVLEL